MTKTGNPHEVARLNALLGRELGTNIYGAPVFSWKWSEDCWWPATRTGRTTTAKVEVPILGGGSETVEHVVPEYAPTRQVRETNKWFMVKWLSPEELIIGGRLRYGQSWGQDVKPSQESMERMWQDLFPGADFPSRGWQVPTNASLPRGIGDPSVPNLLDTEYFIACIKEQTRLSAEARLAEQDAAYEARDEQTSREIGDEARDCFPAFLHDKPGTRSSFVSFPSKETSAGKADIIIPERP